MTWAWCPPPPLPFFRLHSLALTHVPPEIHVHYCAQRRRRRQLDIVLFDVLPGAHPRCFAPPSAIDRKQVVSVDIADANPQHIATASDIGLQLLQVTAPAPAAFSACASRRLLRRWMPAHRGRWSPAACSGSRCTPSPPFRRVHPKSPSRTVVNVCCAAGGVRAHTHEQRQQHSRSVRCTSTFHQCISRRSPPVSRRFPPVTRCFPP